jgi:dipeptidyl aminopeptidase/acylaminoacyl peptidase
LYALNLINGHVARIGKTFNGTIMDYTARSDGGVYILGQQRTDVQIYSQNSTTDDWLLHPGWVGTYQSIASSSNPNCSIAFVYSSSGWPMEIYCANNIVDLLLTEAITNENELFTQRNLPKINLYTWRNEDDNRTIEGILHYPPEKFESKNLRLLVLIHGGPESVSLDRFDATYYHWAPLAASEGWLVLQPNYRGSTGYGNQFTNELRHKPLSIAGRDILSGVDQLVKDGIADPYRLAVGGCSYGGTLTNWLITQTKRFNAALSCAGSVEMVSDWGIMDDPVFYTHWYGGLPWQTSHIYKGEKARLQYSGVRVEYERSTAEYGLSTVEYDGVRVEYGWSTGGVRWSMGGVRWSTTGVQWSTGVPESPLFPLAYLPQ